MTAIEVQASRAIPVSQDFAFAETLPVDLTRLFRHRYGPLPPIRAVRDQDGVWATAGQTRTVALAGGGTMREELLTVERPTRFTYRLSDVTGALRPLVDHIDGAWLFAPVGTGTEITWRWSMHPRSAVTRPVVSAIGRLWLGYARLALAELSDTLVGSA